MTGPDATRADQFRREWNAAFVLVMLAAILLLALGHAGWGAVVAALGAAAYVARRSAMRKLGLGFYGHDRHAS